MTRTLSSTMEPPTVQIPCVFVHRYRFDAPRQVIMNQVNVPCKDALGALFHMVACEYEKAVTSITQCHVTTMPYDEFCDWYAVRYWEHKVFVKDRWVEPWAVSVIHNALYEAEESRRPLQIPPSLLLKKHFKHFEGPKQEQQEHRTIPYCVALDSEVLFRSAPSFRTIRTDVIRLVMQSHLTFQYHEFLNGSWRSRWSSDDLYCEIPKLQWRSSVLRKLYNKEECCFTGGIDPWKRDYARLQLREDRARSRTRRQDRQQRTAARGKRPRSRSRSQQSRSRSKRRRSASSTRDGPRCCGYFCDRNCWGWGYS